jgi:hypothetical protein
MNPYRQQVHARAAEVLTAEQLAALIRMDAELHP